MTAPTAARPRQASPPQTRRPATRPAQGPGKRLPPAGAAFDGDQNKQPQAPGFGPLTVLATIAVTLVTIVTAVSYCRVFPDWSFLPKIVMTVLVVHLALAVCRWFHRGLLLSWAISLAVTIVAVGLFFFPNTLAIIVPTRATWDAGWQAIADSFATFQTTVAPVPSDGGYALAVAIGLALVAIVSDTFAFRAFGRVESIIPAALFFALASSLGVDRNRVIVTAFWLAAGVLAVALLRAAHSESTVPWLGTGQGSRTAAIAGGAGALAVGAILAGVILGPRLPGADSDPIIRTRNRNASNSTIISPLVSVQARLVNRSNVELATVRSDQDAYWRLTALSDFDGKTWTQTSAYSDSLADAFTGSGTTLMRQDFTIVELGESFAPAAFSIVDVSSNETLGFDANTSTLIRRDKLFSGMKYAVQSAVPSYTVEQLRAAGVGQDLNVGFLELPDDFPQNLRDKAAEIVAGQPTAYDQMLTLQNWFQTNFSYNVNVPRGNGDRAMESFINAGEGYCEQFSATFAAFARVLGVPSRVVVGFTPGDRDENGLLHIRGKHAHAWPEVYFDGLGWVTFEPTPGRGAPGAEAWTGRPAQQDGGVLTGPPDRAPANDEPKTTSAAPTQTTNAPTAPTVPREPTGNSSAPKPTVAPRALASEKSSVPTPIIAIGLLLAALAVWMLAMPPISRWWNRRRVGTDPASRVTAAWSRGTYALDLLDAGHRVDETPIEHANRAWHLVGIDQKLLVDLAQAATAATYASGTVTSEVADRSESDARRIGRLALARSDRVRRLAARLDPIRASRLP